jgi:hypothetical protein
MATWRDVQRIALALPGATEEATRSGNAALGDKAPTGAILGVRVADLEMKEVLLASNPQVFFTTPHFDGYPAVLIRLPKISAKLLKDVIVEAWLARAPKRAVTAYLKANGKA